MNVCILIGRLASEPDMRYTPQGTPVTTFRIAVRRPPRQGEGQEGTDFFTVVVFGRQAEAVSTFLDKGALVAVRGQLRSRSWDDPNTGQRRSVVEVVANRVEFLESRAEAERRRAAAAQAGAGPTALADVAPEVASDVADVAPEVPPEEMEEDFGPDESVFGDV